MSFRYWWRQRRSRRRGYNIAGGDARVPLLYRQLAEVFAVAEVVVEEEVAVVDAGDISGVSG